MNVTTETQLVSLDELRPRIGDPGIDAVRHLVGDDLVIGWDQREYAPAHVAARLVDAYDARLERRAEQRRLLELAQRDWDDEHRRVYAAEYDRIKGDLLRHQAAATAHEFAGYTVTAETAGRLVGRYDAEARGRAAAAAIAWMAKNPRPA